MTAPDEKRGREPEPYGIFSTFAQYQAGEYIRDLKGNIYKVTDSSTYNSELEMYDTPTQFFQARSYSPAITEAIEELGADIDRMDDAEVLMYANLKRQNPRFELDEHELEEFATQEPPTFNQEKWQASVDAPLDVPEDDILDNITFWQASVNAPLDVPEGDNNESARQTFDEKNNGEPEPDNPFGSDEFLQPRFYDPAITEAIEGLGANIEFMTDTEVLFYAHRKIQDPTYELSEFEQMLFVKQEPPTFSQEEWQALVDAPLDVPEGDITENARHALTEFDIDINKVIQELDTPDTYEPETKIDLNYQDDFGR